MARILTLAGVSGSGKTTLAGMFIERMPNAAMITSYTTRAFRTSDLLGEYARISNETYDAMVAEDEFLWTVAHGSPRYGTIARDIDAVLRKADGVGIMILVPDKVPALRDYLATRGALEAHVPVYICSPGEKLIQCRLEHRGDTRERIVERLALESGWDGKAGVSGVPYVYVRNEGPIEAAYEQVRALI